MVNLNAGGAGVDKISGVFYSGDSGANWTQLYNLATPGSPDFNIEGQGVVNSALAIDPNNPTHVYVTGSTTADVTLTAYYWVAPSTTANSFITGSDGSTTHPDSRTLLFDGVGRLLVSTDAGLNVKSTPNGPWTSINGQLGVWQAYGAGYDGNNNVIVTAAQDAGICVQPSPNQIVYKSLLITGDGVNAVVNDKTSSTTSYYYSSVQMLSNFNRVTNTSGTQSDPVEFSFTGPTTYFDFSSPVVLNRIDPTKIALASGDGAGANPCEVFLFKDDLTSSSFALTSVGPGVASALGISVAYGTQDAPDALLFGVNDGGTGRLFFTADASSTPLASSLSTYTGNIPNSIVFDGRTKERFYIVDQTTPNQQLWETTDAGTTAFANITANLPANLTGTNSNLFSVEFLSNNGVNALFVGGLSNDGTLSSIAVADSDASGALSNYRLFGTGLPNTMVNLLSYDVKADTLLAGAWGRGNWLMYDVTSNFPAATVLQFGLANNDSTPDTSILTNGTSSSRPLIKYGTGTLTISGDATYTGGTTINTGTLALTGAGSLDSSGAVTVDGTFDISGITASGQTIGDLNGTGTVALGSKALTATITSSSLFSGVINGTGGAFTKEGSGTLTLSGTSTYTGGTIINAGRLAVLSPGNVPGNFTVNGGILSGTGHIGSGGTVTINTGGQLTPGSSIGTLHIDNNLVTNAGSQINFEISPSSNSEIIVTGSSTLNGGTAFVTQDAGTYPSKVSYTLLSSAGGISGNWTLSGSFLPGYSFILQQLSNTINLIYTPITPSGIATSGLSGNALILANYLNANAVTSQAVSLLAPLSGTTLFNALKAASPARNAFSTFINANMMFSVSNLISNHFSGVHYKHIFGNSGAIYMALNESTPSDSLVASNEINQNLTELAYSDEEELPRGSSEQIYRHESNDFWIGGFADFIKQNSEDQNPAFNFNTEGVFVGYDYLNCPETALFGIAAGYTRSDFHEDGSLGKGDVNSFVAAPYATAYFNDFYGELLLAGSVNHIESHRHVFFPGFDGTAKNSHHSYQLMPHLGLGYDYAFSCMYVVEPFATFDCAINWEKEFTEHGGGAFNMSQKGSTSYFLRSEVGLNFYQNWAWCWGFLVLKETGGYVNKAPFGVGKVTAALVGFPGSFAMESFKKNQNLGAWGLSAMFKRTNGFYGMLSYDGEAGSGYLSNEIEAKIGMFF